VRSTDELVARLRALRGWAGVGYREVHRRVVRARQARGVVELPAYDTVYRCFRAGRERLDVELVVEIACALSGDADAAVEWRQAHRVVSCGAETSTVGITAGLPADTGDFTGRAAALELLLREDGAAVAIDGMAGVGKTRLAVRAAHLLLARDRYPVQLAVDLRGYDSQRAPADPMGVLDGFLRSLGVPGSGIDGMDLAGRVAAFRRHLGERAALILLDNAASAEQVRPLLPDTPGSRVLVTSRRRLAGLPGTTHLTLGVFTSAESVELLRRGVGTERIAAEPDTAARIADAVGHLPLAVAVVASRIAATPGWTLADHLDRLTERRTHFHLDDGVSVALALSYEDLADEDRRLLRLLALPPGRDIDLAAAAALAGVDPVLVGRWLRNLMTENLVQEPTTGRYRLHDLVRLFAVARAADEDPARVRRTALTRLFDHYRYAASVAMDHYAPSERHRRPRLTDPGTPRSAVTDRESATEWLETERGNLVASATYCADHGRQRHAADFSTILFRFLNLAAHYDDAEALHSAAARSTGGGDHGRALSRLGVLYLSRGRYTAAVEHLRAALTAVRAVGDRTSETSVLNNLGTAYLDLSRYADALRCYERAADIARQQGDPLYGGLLTNAGEVHNRLRRHDQAFELLTRAVEFLGGTGDRAAQGLAHGHLGQACAGLGRHADALDHAERYLAAAREVGHRMGEADALTTIGALHTGMGSPELAVDPQRQALAIVGDAGMPGMAAEVHNDLGHTLRRQGRPTDAAEHHRRALTLATGCGVRYEQARAHDGLADTLYATGDHAAARTHWQRALAIHTDIGTPDAADVAARLRSVGPARPPDGLRGPAVRRRSADRV
jgi:tetratricopeptide (TPR) repeat protein